MNDYEMLRDAIDFHMHVGPEPGVRYRVDYIEAAKQARDVGMKALVYKPLAFHSVNKAHAAEKAVNGIKVFGGILLGNAVGGFNPLAVREAIDLGAKVLYMPLHDSAHEVAASRAMPFYKERVSAKTGLSVLAKNNELDGNVAEILDIVADSKGTIIETSHISPEESLILIEEAKKKGIVTVVSHPTAPLIGASIEQQKEMVKKGAYLCQVFGFCLPHPKREALDIRVISKTIKAVGARQHILATDMGIYRAPLPVEGFRTFIIELMELGIDQREIDLMTKENPAKILGI